MHLLRNSSQPRDSYKKANLEPEVFNEYGNLQRYSANPIVKNNRYKRFSTPQDTGTMNQTDKFFKSQTEKLQEEILVIKEAGDSKIGENDSPRKTSIRVKEML